MGVTFLHVLINQDAKPHSPPLGPLYLVAVLRRAGIEVHFKQYVHLRGTTLRIESLTQAMLQTKSQVIALSSMINALPIIIPAVQKVREASPEIKIIAGGPGYNGIANTLLTMYPVFDAIAMGEGESIIESLVRAILARTPLDFVPGITFRSVGGPRSTPSVPRNGDLDQLPYPAYDLIDLDQYHNVSLIASRGCPYSCTFCDVAPAWGRKHRRRSVEGVVSELSYLRSEYGCERVGFVDDIFVLDRRWVKQFCEELIAKKVAVRWRCTGHINLMDDELLPLMQQAGCESLFFGIESGSDTILRKISKGFSVEKVLDTVIRTSRFIPVAGNLMWGFPFEQVTDTRQTLSLRERLLAMGVQCSLVYLAPLASASLFRDEKLFNASLVFSPESPNIFYMDYEELANEDRSTIEQIIRSSVETFSAFYYYRTDALPAMWECVRDGMAAEWVQQIMSPAWQTV